MPRGHPKRVTARSELVPGGQAGDLLPPIQGPELVFGLVGPIGTNMTAVAEVLAEELEKVGYRAIQIHITELLGALKHGFKLVERPLEERYKSYIDAGNKLRKKLKLNDVFALLSVARIRNTRATLTGSNSSPANHTAYILNQFKRPEEIETLRKVYGRAFFQISAYSSRANRVASLTRRIAESRFRDKPDEYYRGKAHDLTVRDEAEEENAYGQRVRDVFPLADVMIAADSEQIMRQTTSRFVRAYFGDPFITPNQDEQGIFLARSVAIRSSDLSRQVGAVIATKDGQIISIGCNEVPKAFGGIYWEGDNPDGRDFRLGYDSSVKVKNELLQDVFRRLKSAHWLSSGKQKMEVDALVRESLFGKSPVMDDAQVMNVLEFGRIVHAEMAAISDAARLGKSVTGATLYSTTFPCHICARHIVAAGIERVVYVEPYPKSLAAELYPDSIQIEDVSGVSKKRVSFEPFIGIAPQRYTEIFLEERARERIKKEKQGSGIPRGHHLY